MVIHGIYIILFVIDGKCKSVIDNRYTKRVPLIYLFPDLYWSVVNGSEGRFIMQCTAVNQLSRPISIMSLTFRKVKLNKYFCTGLIVSKDFFIYS